MRMRIPIVAGGLAVILGLAYGVGLTHAVPVFCPIADKKEAAAKLPEAVTAETPDLVAADTNEEWTESLASQFSVAPSQSFSLSSLPLLSERNGMPSNLLAGVLHSGGWTNRGPPGSELS